MARFVLLLALVVAPAFSLVGLWLGAPNAEALSIDGTIVTEILPDGTTRTTLTSPLKPCGDFTGDQKYPKAANNPRQEAQHAHDGDLRSSSAASSSGKFDPAEITRSQSRSSVA